MCGILYLSLWTSYFYFNGKVTDSNGDEIPVHEAIQHFFTSPFWTDLKQSLYDTYVYAQHHGWFLYPTTLTNRLKLIETMFIFLGTKFGNK